MSTSDLFDIAGDLASTFTTTDYKRGSAPHRAFVNFKRQAFAHIVRQWRQKRTAAGLALSAALRHHLRHV